MSYENVAFIHRVTCLRVLALVAVKVRFALFTLRAIRRATIRALLIRFASIEYLTADSERFTRFGTVYHITH